MRRTWLLAFLFLTLWQMFPHEGYNMLYAQGMGDESYGGGYDCDDDGYGAYSSSLPCDETPCVTPCPACHVTYACDEIDNHTCPADNITCSFCGESMTPEQYLNHTCSNQNEEEHCAICGRTIDQCSCEGPVITPNNPSVPPNNPSTGGGTHTGGGGGNNNGGNNSNTQGSSENNPDEGTFDDLEDTSSDPWSKESILARAGNRNKKIQVIIDSLNSWDRIKVDSLIENCKYIQEDSSIHVPAAGGFGEESVIHEVIHYVQEDNGMLNYNLCSADNEYQAYVLNYIFNITYDKLDEVAQPQGAKDTEQWNIFIKKIPQKTTNNNGEFTYTDDFINALNTLDHESLSASFRSYYESLDDYRESQGHVRKYENYYRHHDSKYNYNWEKILNDIGFTKK